jgi:hypothetical protein
MVAPADRSACDEQASEDAVRRNPARAAWRWLPRCTRCGRWIAPPGGEGFGGGEVWCGSCVLRHILRVANREMG